MRTSEPSGRLIDYIGLGVLSTRFDRDLDVVDTPGNVARFGRVGSGPKASAYPKLHVAALAECGTHAIVGAVLGSCRTGERTLAAAYQQRWEEESALGEIKTDLRGRGEILRSKTPDLAEQQMWGLLLAHYAIRALLVTAAYDPDRMSFIQGVRVVRRQVTDQAVPARTPLTEWH